MPTTSDVLDQHLKCFGENDLDGVLADYSSDAVLFVPDKPLRGARTQSSRFSRLSVRSLPSPARRFRCGEQYVEGDSAYISVERRNRQQLYEAATDTSYCAGRERSWRSPLLGQVLPERWTPSAREPGTVTVQRMRKNKCRAPGKDAQ